jgi:hypothetical protein
MRFIPPAALVLLMSTASVAAEKNFERFGFSIDVPEGDGWNQATSHLSPATALLLKRDAIQFEVMVRPTAERSDELTSADEEALVKWKQRQMEKFFPDASVRMLDRGEMTCGGRDVFVLAHEIDDPKRPMTLVSMLAANGAYQIVLNMSNERDDPRDTPEVKRLLDGIRFTSVDAPAADVRIVEPVAPAESEDSPYASAGGIVGYGVFALLIGAWFAWYVRRKVIQRRTSR